MAVLAAAGLILAAVLSISYWGAGLLLRPPRMSALSLFPGAFGLPYEKVEFLARDGHSLSGWFVPSPTPRAPTVVVCHGWGDNKGEVLERTAFLNRTENFNLLYFDFRGHGESGASLVTLGKLELLDLAAAVHWLERHKPDCCGRLGLFGYSMGAAVAAQFIASRGGVRAAVLESPFADYREVGGRWAWEAFRVPYFPVIPLIMLWARLRSGHWDIDRYSPAAALGAARTPLLFIAGENDGLMPPEVVHRLRECHGGPSEFWVVPAAEHGKCRTADPAGYADRVGSFFRRWLRTGPDSPASSLISP